MKAEIKDIPSSKKNHNRTNNSNANVIPAHETGISPISPVIINCLQKLREVQLQMEEFFESNPVLADCIRVDYAEFDGSIIEAVHSLAEIAQQELLENLFYQEEKKTTKK